MNFKLPFGLKDGELLHVADVERGLSCECVCPSCGHHLVARKGNKMTPHFAHYKGAECAAAIESALHLAAKKVLLKEQYIVLPPV